MGEWISEAAARKLLCVSRKGLEHFVLSRVISVRFEGSAKGIARRYAASDIKRIKADVNQLERLKAEAKRLVTEEAQLALKRRERIERERLDRARRYIEQQEQTRLALERQRIVSAVLEAKAKAAGAR